MITRRGFLAAALPALAQERVPFRWPEGRRFALSLTFDDARLSQVDAGMALLNRLGVKATFYVSLNRLGERLEGWKAAAAAGHEIGNHSGSHPCTGNYRFSRANALEEYTLARMEADLNRATAEIQRALGVKPVSFAYPCGQKFVGRGEQTASYVPLVARRFLSGRGYLDEAANDPEICDLAQLMGTGFDDMSFEQMRPHVEAAAKEGRWLIFVGHEMGRRAHQSVELAALEQLCRYAGEAANGVWLETVRGVAGYLRKARGA